MKEIDELETAFKDHLRAEKSLQREVLSAVKRYPLLKSRGPEKTNSTKWLSSDHYVIFVIKIIFKL